MNNEYNGSFYDKRMNNNIEYLNNLRRMQGVDSDFNDFDLKEYKYKESETFNYEKEEEFNEFSKTLNNPLYKNNVNDDSMYYGTPNNIPNNYSNQSMEGCQMPGSQQNEMYYNDETISYNQEKYNENNYSENSFNSDYNLEYETGYKDAPNNNYNEEANSENTFSQNNYNREFYMNNDDIQQNIKENSYNMNNYYEQSEINQNDGNIQEEYKFDKGNYDTNSFEKEIENNSQQNFNQENEFNTNYHQYEDTQSNMSYTSNDYYGQEIKTEDMNNFSYNNSYNEENVLNEKENIVNHNNQYDYYGYYQTEEGRVDTPKMNNNTQFDVNYQNYQENNIDDNYQDNVSNNYKENMNDNYTNNEFNNINNTQDYNYSNYENPNNNGFSQPLNNYNDQFNSNFENVNNALNPNSDVRKSISFTKVSETIGEIASKSLRKKAYIIDKIIFAIPVILMYFVFLNNIVLEVLRNIIKYNSPLGSLSVLIGKVFGFIIIYHLLYLGYYVLIPYLLKGQSVGKKICNLRIVCNDIDNKNVTFNILLKREMVEKFKESIFFIGYLKSLCGKSLVFRHDERTNTRVIFEQPLDANKDVDYDKNIPEFIEKED